MKLFSVQCLVLKTGWSVLLLGISPFNARAVPDTPGSLIKSDTGLTINNSNPIAHTVMMTSWEYKLCDDKTDGVLRTVLLL
jgi:hypothetical protein